MVGVNEVGAADGVRLGDFDEVGLAEGGRDEGLGDRLAVGKAVGAWLSVGDSV